MAENKMKEVARLLGVELEEEFKIYGWDGFYKITELGLERYVQRRGWIMDPIMLIDLIKGTAKIVKIPKQILDEKEKEYLSNVIKPFRDRIIHIYKTELLGYELICIALECPNKTTYKDAFTLPFFEKGTMYKGMKFNKKYTLKELEL